MERPQSVTGFRIPPSDTHLGAVLGIVLLFVLAESLILFQFGLLGLSLHGLATMLVLVTIQVSDGKHQLLYQSLILIPVLRVFNLGLPRFIGNELVFLGVIYVFLFLSSWLVMRSQSLTFSQVGVGWEKIRSIVPGLALGLIFGSIQYTLNLESFQFEPTVLNYLFVILFAGVLVGFVEEIIFRGIIQRRFTEVFGARLSIIIVSILFGFMHSVWLAPMDIVFAGGVSLLIGYLYHEYRDMILITAFHGGINIASFFLLPFLLT